MAIWQKKFTLLDLYKCGYLNDVLPQISERYKGKTQENKIFNEEDITEPSGKSYTLKNSVPLASIEKQIKNNVVLRVNSISKATATKGNVNFYLKSSDYNKGVDIYNQIVKEIKAMRTTLAYVNSFAKEIETALKYSMTKEINGKYVPRIALKINSLEELKGMGSIQKKHIVENIIESILFDDDFSSVRSYAKTNLNAYKDTLDKEHKYRYWKTLKKDYDLRVERYTYEKGWFKI